MKKNNKICLITPPSPFLLDERVFMHIGILKVAAVLDHKEYKVDFLDLSGVERCEDVIQTYMGNNPTTKIFGITATTPQIPSAFKISSFIKNQSLDTKIILGGPHPSLMNSAKKKEEKKGYNGRATRDIEALLKGFDVLVAGDGEKAIFEALRIEKGVVDADQPSGELFLTSEELAQFPFPARHLVDVDSYHYTIEGAKAVSVICQLGCPFACTFCGGRNSPFLRRIRTRSSDSVIKEIEQLYETYDFKGFMFYDDELNVNKEWEILLQKLIGLQKKLGEQFKFRGFVKAELFTQRQADLMYEAGFRWLLTGFESGDEQVLLNIKKKADVAANTRCINYAKDAGLKVKALMSIGHAGESKKTIKNTKDWLLEVKPDDFDCTIITTYPGSPYFDDAIYDEDKYVYTQPTTGDKLYQKDLNYLDEPDYYKGDPEEGYRAYVWTDHITSEELVKERDKLENEVRDTLNIPFNPAGGVIEFEHSMGQGQIPDSILRKNYS
jgi:anaerobic magnesium-protoporphyrin IX monomethyl ester cyclase